MRTSANDPAMQLYAELLERERAYFEAAKMVDDIRQVGLFSLPAHLSDEGEVVMLREAIQNEKAALAALKETQRRADEATEWRSKCR